MRNLAAILSAAVAVGIVATVAAWAAIPRTLNYQAILTAGGSPVVSPVTMTFRIYDSDDGGNLLWNEGRLVYPDDAGRINIRLGESNPIPDSAFSGPESWLSIQVASDPELEPWIRLTTSPYSFRVRSVDGAVGGTVSGALGLNYGVGGPGKAATMAEEPIRLDPDDPEGPSMGIRDPGGGYTILSGGSTDYYEDALSHKDIATLVKKVEVGTSGLIIFGDLESDTVVHIGPSGTVKADGNLQIGGSARIGEYSSVVGNSTFAACRSTAAADYAFAAGCRARAYHRGAFVWADSSNFEFTSIAQDEFAVRARTGMRVQADSTYGYGLDVLNDGNGDGIRATSHVSQGTLWGALFAHNTGTSPAIYARSTLGPAAYLDGNVIVNGTLSKGGGSFKIDHPLDPANKYLYHSFVESPDMMNVYNGNAVCDAAGTAVVTLPDYFEALNSDFRYQLTCIGGFAPVYVAEKISGNRFRIAGGTPGLEVSWQVTGVRQDAFANANRIPVEEVKPTSERGRYLHPAALGLPASMGVNSDDTKQPGAGR